MRRTVWNNRKKARLLRDAFGFQERIFVLIEQEFPAMGSEIEQDRALCGHAQLEIGHAMRIAQDPGLPDMRRDLLRQGHDDSPLPPPVTNGGVFLFPCRDQVNAGQNVSHKKEPRCVFATGFFSHAAVGVQP
jgi:hypothetical protein